MDADDAQARPETAAPVLLRPHHVLCAIGWQGKGYSPAFSANMDRIVVDRLRADPGTELVISGGADAICAPCPHRRGTGCAAGARITRLDARHAAALGLTPGQRLSWRTAEARAAALHPDRLDQICDGCQWLRLGLCKAALARLRETKNAAP